MISSYTPPPLDTMGDSEQMGSIIYRSTIRYGLAVLVLSWTIVATALALLVTAALITFIKGYVNATELALAAAVTAILTIPISYKIGKLLRDLERSRTALRHLAQVDALTGLANRGYFFRRAEQMLHPKATPVWPLSALMIDVDRFKTINDEAGHAVGDQVLSQVARVLERNLRGGDFVARYGGEEFAIVLYEASREYVAEVVTRIQRSIAELNIQHEASRVASRLTVSIGAAFVLPAANRTLEGLIQLADEALYSAKEEGRNRVVVMEAEYHTMRTGRFEKRRHRVDA
jgi:diguanylate cyclase (GGDEF)-like protein